MQLKYGLADVALLLFYVIESLASIERLELIMPKYAIRGGDAILRCEHSVPPEQLYKVEWQRAGTKIFQYIKGRNPPFRFFKTSGAELNKAHSSEKQIQLSKLDFSATGSYSCAVTMETPIFSKDSESHVLTVIGRTICQIGGTAGCNAACVTSFINQGYGRCSLGSCRCYPAN